MPASSFRVVLKVNELGSVAQTVDLAVTNPLRLVVMPPTDDKQVVRIENPSGEPLKGVLRLSSSSPHRRTHGRRRAGVGRVRFRNMAMR